MDSGTRTLNATISAQCKPNPEVLALTAAIIVIRFHCKEGVTHKYNSVAIHEKVSKFPRTLRSDVLAPEEYQKCVVTDLNHIKWALKENWVRMAMRSLICGIHFQRTDAKQDIIEGAFKFNYEILFSTGEYEIELRGSKGLLQAIMDTKMEILKHYKEPKTLTFTLQEEEEEEEEDPDTSFELEENTCGYASDNGNVQDDINYYKQQFDIYRQKTYHLKRHIDSLDEVIV